MVNMMIHVPMPSNEPLADYNPGAPERRRLTDWQQRLQAEPTTITPIIGGRRVETGQIAQVRCPHNHSLALGQWHGSTPDHAQQAVEAALAASPQWSMMPWQERVTIFLKAAELLSTRYRAVVNAATMLGQSKTVQQAEIDIAELIDFWRFNSWYMARLYEEQPTYSVGGVWNRLDYRPLEGFVLAVTPFNFTSIAGNLPTAPALLGNTVVWKPASTALLAAHYIMEILHEAGLPDGIINMLPGPGAALVDPLLRHPNLAGVHFTGSTPVFQQMYKTVGENITRYRSWPRMVGETGGKNFVVIHPSADLDSVVTGIVRGGFEYQGQKCSAASRVYAPASLWPRLRQRLVEAIGSIRMGDPADFRNFMAAVIDRKAYEKILSYAEFARQGDSTRILAGGEGNREEGWFIQPTLVETTDPRNKLMEEEIFGPIVTAYAYPDDRWEETLRLCDATSPYALTGAVFARDRQAIGQACQLLRQAAGNFYINDKPTGAVVGQQPFGGARGSGTNDKAGSVLNLVRWTSTRAIKESYNPPRHFPYPHERE